MSTPLWREPAFWATIACAAALRLWGLFRHPTIVDEAFTFYIASHSTAQIIHLLRVGDFHPPLVYLIGHALLGLTSKAYELRLVTALFGIVGVAATYALARRVVGSWAPVAALLVAFNPLLIFYDGMFRMYAMLWSIAMLSWACLFWALDEPQRRWRWAPYAMVLVALLYTHYLAIFTLVAQLVFVAIFRRRATGFWVTSAIAIAAFLPWLPVFLSQYPLGGNAFNSRLAGHTWELAQAPAVLLVDGLPPSLEYALALQIALDAVVLAGLAIACAQRNWPALALGAPVAIQLIYALVSGKLILGERYLLQAAVPLAFFCVIFFRWLAARLLPASLALICALGVLAVAGTADKHLLAPYQPFDWTEYGHFLDAKIRPGDTVVFDGALSYYALIGTSATTGRPIFLISDVADANRFAARAAQLGRTWYIGYQAELPDPHRLVFGSLVRTHPHHISWGSTASAYGDAVLTALFLPGRSERSP